MKYSLSYLYADHTASAAAILAFIYCLITAAQCIKPQDSSHAVPNEANLGKQNLRFKFAYMYPL